MITKKKTKTVKDKPMISEKTYAEQIGYFTMVLEGMRYDMKGFGEQLAAARIEFNEKLDQQGEKLESEIRLTQHAVRSNGQEIKEVQSELKATREELKSDIQQVETKLTSEINRVENNLRSEMHEIRDELTSEIRQVGKSVEKHDEDIVFLKTAMMKE